MEKRNDRITEEEKRILREKLNDIQEELDDELEDIKEEIDERMQDLKEEREEIQGELEDVMEELEDEKQDLLNEKGQIYDELESMNGMVRDHVEKFQRKVENNKQKVKRTVDKFNEKIQKKLDKAERKAKKRINISVEGDMSEDWRDWAEDLGTSVSELVRKSMGFVKENIGDLRKLEKMVMLNVIDNMWRGHLLEMDYLKEGIGLRAIAQKDPLVEYKHEAFSLFKQLINEIKFDTVKLLFNARIVSAEQQQRHDQQLRNVSTSGPTAPEEKKKQPVRAASEKVGRNEPCPCGSGKKYKKCCGK